MIAPPDARSILLRNQTLTLLYFDLRLPAEKKMRDEVWYGGNEDWSYRSGLAVSVSVGCRV